MIIYHLIDDHDDGEERDDHDNGEERDDR